MVFTLAGEVARRAGGPEEENFAGVRWPTRLTEGRVTSLRAEASAKVDCDEG